MHQLLGAPSQWLLGVDSATVIWENFVLTAVSALLVYAMVRRLADGRAAIVAIALMLLVPGMLENSRGALTMVPATTFGALALVAVVAGGGLSRWRWSALLGVAIGCMSLSRTMSIAFIPGLAVPAIVWSKTLGASRRVVVRNAVVAGVVAAVVSLWWWAINYDTVFDYLTVGSPGVATSNPFGVFASRVTELILYVGPPRLLAAGITYLVLARRRRPSAPAATATSEPMVVLPGSYSEGVVEEAILVLSDASSGEVSDGAHRESHVESRWFQAETPVASLDGRDLTLPLWPVWGAVGVSLLVSLVSKTLGWLMLPLVPWLAVAAVAGVRRRFDERSWRTWATVVVGVTALVALLSSTVWIKPGNRFTWCQEPIMKTSACPITSDAEAAAWRDDIDTIVDDTFDAHNALLTEGRTASVAIAARDHIVLPSSIQLGAELRHRWDFDAYRYFSSDLSSEAQLDEVRREADIVIVSPDVEPVVLTPEMYDPDELSGQLVGHGFAGCQTVELPDGRMVELIVREPVPTDACT
jgi:hypothetical protein